MEAHLLTWIIFTPLIGGVLILFLPKGATGLIKWIATVTTMGVLVLASWALALFAPAAPGFQMLAGRVGPSHAWVHLEAIETTVTVANMSVKSGDLIHADRHGAVVIPDHLAAKVPGMAGLLVRREAVLLARARLPGFNAQAIAEALATADDIH